MRKTTAETTDNKKKFPVFQVPTLCCIDFKIIIFTIFKEEKDIVENIGKELNIIKRTKLKLWVRSITPFIGLTEDWKQLKKGICTLDVSLEHM